MIHTNTTQFNPDNDEFYSICSHGSSCLGPPDVSLSLGACASDRIVIYLNRHHIGMIKEVLAELEALPAEESASDEEAA